MLIKNKVSTNPIIYHKTPAFLSSSYAKGNVGKNSKILKQNNTGTYFENIIRSRLNNVVPVNKKTYKKLTGRFYEPDIETTKSIIECKCQETDGTAYEKLLMTIANLDFISTQTNKNVILLCSDFTYLNYYADIDIYANMLKSSNIYFYTETSFKLNCINL